MRGSKITVIKLKVSTREELKRLKSNSRETYDNLILRLMKGGKIK
jgi:hypothetical protein